MDNTRDEHDITRKMLQTMRESHVPKYSKNLQFLKEAATPLPQGQMNVVGDDEQAQMNVVGDEDENDSIQPSQEEITQEEQKFREVVGPRVEFTTFKIYPQADNVVFGGKFQDMDGLEWQFSLEETDGLYITTNNMQVSDDVVTRIQKLKGYYDNWAGEWSNKLATEYKSR